MLDPLQCTFFLMSLFECLRTKGILVQFVYRFKFRFRTKQQIFMVINKMRLTNRYLRVTRTTRPDPFGHNRLRCRRTAHLSAACPTSRERSRLWGSRLVAVCWWTDGCVGRHGFVDPFCSVKRSVASGRFGYVLMCLISLIKCLDCLDYVIYICVLHAWLRTLNGYIWYVKKYNAKTYLHGIDL